MSAVATRSDAPPKWLLWTGRVVSVLPALLLFTSAGLKLSHAPQFVAMFTNKLGYQESSLTGIGLLELACTALYLIPQTAFLGALLLTGYLGGATCINLRDGQSVGGALIPAFIGVILWAGLWLRNRGVLYLLPVEGLYVYRRTA